MYADRLSPLETQSFSLSYLPFLFLPFSSPSRSLSLPLPLPLRPFLLLLPPFLPLSFPAFSLALSVSCLDAKQQEFGATEQKKKKDGIRGGPSSLPVGIKPYDCGILRRDRASSKPQPTRASDYNDGLPAISTRQTQAFGLLSKRHQTATCPPPETCLRIPFKDHQQQQKQQDQQPWQQYQEQQHEQQQQQHQHGQRHRQQQKQQQTGLEGKTAAARCSRAQQLWPSSRRSGGSGPVKPRSLLKRDSSGFLGLHDASVQRSTARNPPGSKGPPGERAAATTAAGPGGDPPLLPTPSDRGEERTVSPQPKEERGSFERLSWNPRVTPPVAAAPNEEKEEGGPSHPGSEQGRPPRTCCRPRRCCAAFLLRLRLLLTQARCLPLFVEGPGGPLGCLYVKGGLRGCACCCHFSPSSASPSRDTKATTTAGAAAGGAAAAAAGVWGPLAWGFRAGGCLCGGELLLHARLIPLKMQMGRGGFRGSSRGGDKGYYGGDSLQAYQTNGRHEGPRGGGGWGPPPEGWQNRSFSGSGSRNQGRSGGGYSSSSSSNSARCWGRDQEAEGAWHARGGGGRGGRGSHGRRRGRGGEASFTRREAQGEYGREDSVKMAEAPPPLKQSIPAFCQNFAFYGASSLGPLGLVSLPVIALLGACKRYQHALECVGYQEEAHGGKGIRCCVVAPAASEIFTGGKDKKLTRWQIVQPPLQGAGGGPSGAAPEGGEVDSTGAPLLALNCLTSTDMGAEVCCLKLLGGALFAGLGDGKIKVFLASGLIRELNGHEKSVHALLLVEGVLLSADWGGCLRFWRFDETQQTFVLFQMLSVEGNVCCLQTADVPLPQQQQATQGGPPAGAPAPPLTRKVLWVGGTCLSIVDLQSMQVARVLDISDVKGNGPPLVLSILPFNDFLLVGFASGAITAYTADGEREYCYSSDYLSTMEGLISPEGPVLIYGGRRSSLRVLKVPEFEERGSLAAHESGDLKAVCALGGTHFVSCGDDGAIAIWKWAVQQDAAAAQHKP
ncbi:hypothetical protein Esti_004141 [Eimeria stiedai]